MVILLHLLCDINVYFLPNKNGTEKHFYVRKCFCEAFYRKIAEKFIGVEMSWIILTHSNLFK